MLRKGQIKSNPIEQNETKTKQTNSAKGVIQILFNHLFLSYLFSSLLSFHFLTLFEYFGYVFTRFSHPNSSSFWKAIVKSLKNNF